MISCCKDGIRISFSYQPELACVGWWTRTCGSFGSTGPADWLTCW